MTIIIRPRIIDKYQHAKTTKEQKNRILNVVVNKVLKGDTASIDHC